MANDSDTPVRRDGAPAATAAPPEPLVGHRQARRSRVDEARRENWPGEGDLAPPGGRSTPPPAWATPVPSGKDAASAPAPGPAIGAEAGARKEALGPAGLPGREPGSGGWPGQADTGPVAGSARRGLGRLHPARLLDRVGRRPLRRRAETVDPFGYDARYAAGIEPLIEFLYERYFRVRLLGAEHLPGRGAALLVANHSGTLPLDAVMIMEAVRRTVPPRRLRPLVEDFAFHAPVVGPAIRRMGGVRAHFENGERLLGAGQLVAVFPEGIQGVSKPFRKRYQLQRFGRGGFVRLALQTRAPIVPVAVVGAEETYPLLARLPWLARPLGLPFVPVTPTFPWLGPLGALPLPARWTIRIGAPLNVAASYGAEERDDRVLVARLAEQVRATIQQMVDETLRERRSVLRG